MTLCMFLIIYDVDSIKTTATITTATKIIIPFVVRYYEFVYESCHLQC